MPKIDWKKVTAYHALGEPSYSFCLFVLFNLSVLQFDPNIKQCLLLIKVSNRSWRLICT